MLLLKTSFGSSTFLAVLSKFMSVDGEACTEGRAESLPSLSFFIRRFFWEVYGVVSQLSRLTSVCLTNGRFYVTCITYFSKFWSDCLLACRVRIGLLELRSSLLLGVASRDKLSVSSCPNRSRTIVDPKAIGFTKEGRPFKVCWSLSTLNRSGVHSDYPRSLGIFRGWES